MKKIAFVIFATSLFAIGCTSVNVEPLPEGCTTTMSYATDIKPILDTKCNSCHTTGGTGTGDFTVFAELKGKVNDGTFKNRVFTVKDMPPSTEPGLTPDELSKLKCWVAQGAQNN